MDLFHGLITGLQVAMQPGPLFACFVGVLIGTLVGLLPGIGPTATIALLLPFTFKLSPVSAIIMLAGIYYGGMYGGSTTSILLNIPGEFASVVTCIDGYQMARQGRAGPALGIAAFGSFIAGTFGVIGLAVIAPPLARFALRFGPPEYFSLMVLSLTLVVFLTSGKMWKGLMMASFGTFLGTVGMDRVEGATARFTFNILELMDGVGLIPVLMGLFGITEVLLNIEQSINRSVFEKKLTHLLPSLKDWKDSTWPIIRGTVLGFFIGVLPGGSAVLSSFLSYATEKRLSKHPEKFGKGAIEGVAGPESANNSATAGCFIPLFTLGIPSNSTTAILLGALIVFGMQPGPLLLTQHPQLFWGTIASMYIGNGMLLILNLPLIGLWVKILKVPYPILFPLILLFCLVGAYTANYSITEMLMMVVFGFLGYIFKKFEYEAVPLILGLVVSPMIETNLRLSLLLSEGDLRIFITRPISLILLIMTMIPLAYFIVPWLRKKRAIIPKGEEEV